MISVKQKILAFQYESVNDDTGSPIGSITLQDDLSRYFSIGWVNEGRNGKRGGLLSGRRSKSNTYTQIKGCILFSRRCHNQYEIYLKVHQMVPQYLTNSNKVLVLLQTDRVVTHSLVREAFDLVQDYVSPRRTGAQAKSTPCKLGRSTSLDEILHMVPVRYDERAYRMPDRHLRLKQILCRVPGYHFAPNVIPVFPSYTSLVSGIESGRVDLGMLFRGLFAFGCTEEHVESIRGKYKLEIDPEDPEYDPRIEMAFKIIVLAAARLAEQEGRIIWRTLEERNMTFEKVNALLQSNGYAPVSDNGTYCYPALQVRVEKHDAELVVIW